MNMRTIYTGIFAFSAIAAALIVGATGRGQTSELSPETSIEISCGDAAWPKIPAACLTGGTAGAVRFVDAEIEAAELEADAELEDLKHRFRWAFGRFEDE